MEKSENKSSFRSRSFVAIMACLTGLTLPISGLILHTGREFGRQGGNHDWFHVHVFLGIAFTGFVIWHVILNRKVFIRYLKTEAGGKMRFSRETRIAAVTLVAGLIAIIIHSCI